MVTSVDEIMLTPGAFIEGTIEFPVLNPDSEVQYDSYVSENDGRSWQHRMRGTMKGDHQPATRPSDPDHPVSYGFSHSGLPCIVRTIIQTSREQVVIPRTRR